MLYNLSCHLFKEKLLCTFSFLLKRKHLCDALNLKEKKSDKTRSTDVLTFIFLIISKFGHSFVREFL